MLNWVIFYLEGERIGIIVNYTQFGDLLLT